MITVHDWMDPSGPQQCIDVREKAVQKIRPNSCANFPVEMKAVYQVFLGLIENFDSHGTLPRTADLADSPSAK